MDPHIYVPVTMPLEGDIKEDVLNVFVRSLCDSVRRSATPLRYWCDVKRRDVRTSTRVRICDCAMNIYIYTCCLKLQKRGEHGQHAVIFGDGRGVEETSTSLLTYDANVSTCVRHAVRQSSNKNSYSLGF